MERVATNESPPNDFTVLDWIGLLVTILVGIYGMTLVLQIPAIAAMYDDFGGRLPRMTMFVILQWPTALGSLFATVLAITAIAKRRARLAQRRLLAMSGFALAVLTVFATYLALYMPLYAMADAIN